MPCGGSAFDPVHEINDLGASQAMSEVIVRLMACLLKLHESIRDALELRRSCGEKILPWLCRFPAPIPFAALFMVAC